MQILEGINEILREFEENVTEFNQVLKKSLKFIRK